MGHWKLVRDRNREHWGGVVSGQWRVSADPAAALRKKLAEELGEYFENHDPGELMDLQDVLAELIRLEDPDGEHAGRHMVKVRRYGLFFDHVEWTPDPREE